jgi:hypothetical protein
MFKRNSNLGRTEEEDDEARPLRKTPTDNFNNISASAHMH